MENNIQEALKFNYWITHVIKSKHLSNTESMLNAYEKIKPKRPKNYVSQFTKTQSN